MKGLKDMVLLSHSENDKDSEYFEQFRTDNQYKVLVAVDRGKLGYNLPDLFNVVDFTMTQSLDMILQMMGRILRLSKEKNQKIYFKVASKNTAGYFVDLMTAALCLFKMEWYSKFNGKNMGGIMIPKIKTNRPKTNGKSTSSNKKKQTQRITTLEELGIPLDLNLFNQSILYSQGDKFSTVAWTTLDDVRREFFGLQKQWTEDEIREEALKYKTVGDFLNYAGNAYQASRKRGIFEEVTSHMSYMFNNWSEDEIRDEALKYKTKSEFIKNGKGASQIAKKLGIYEDVCSHMDTLRKYWTEDEIRKEALKYKTKTEFQKNASGASKKAITLGIYDEVCSHMETKLLSFTKKEVIKEAKKYKTRSEFKNNTKYSNAAYRWAKNNNLLDKVCAHMKTRNSWDLQSVKFLAKKYTSKGDFLKNNSGAYKAANRFGILDKIFK
jgi:hypothetical protein